MTLSEFLATNPTFEEAKDKCIVFSSEVCATMLAKQDTLDTNIKVLPRHLTDGQYGTCCDLLSEVSAGGVYHELWYLLDKDVLGATEVIDGEEYLSLLPEK